VIPYHIGRVTEVQRNNDRRLQGEGLRPLSLLQRREALQLFRDMATGDKVLQREVEGVIWFCARKIILEDVRLPVREADVDTYEDAMKTAQEEDGSWTMHMFTVVTRTLKYNSEECSCTDWSTYGNCAEVHTARIYDGRTTAQPTDFSDAASTVMPTGITQSICRTKPGPSTKKGKKGESSFVS
jgi:hypothetical protein